jgi:hypothetical protein
MFWRLTLTKLLSYPFYNLDADGVEAHHQATLERIRAGRYQRILAVQDTTENNYRHHPATQALGPLDHAQGKGFFVHSTLAVSTEGVPLGLLAQEVWVREEGGQPQAKDRPIAEKESYNRLRALHDSSRDLPSRAQVVQVSDQQNDLYKYLVEPRRANVEWLVRSYQTWTVLDEQIRAQKWLRPRRPPTPHR